jgi:hypothetical protein
MFSRQRTPIRKHRRTGRLWARLKMCDEPCGALQIKRGCHVETLAPPKNRLTYAAHSLCAYDVPRSPRQFVAFFECSTPPPYMLGRLECHLLKSAHGCLLGRHRCGHNGKHSYLFTPRPGNSQPYFLFQRDPNQRKPARVPSVAAA